MSTSPFTTLIGAADLQALIAGGAPLRILDASFDLADPAAGARLYAEAHLPGALHIDLERALSGPKQPGGVGGRHPLPTREAFAATLGDVGITPQTQVVAYDRSGGFYAARCWWLLRWLGHANVAVLDGGLAAWTAISAASSQAEPVIALTPYPIGEPLVAPIDADALQRRLGRWPLVDARAVERFRGEVEPLDARAGHIPGALNRHFARNLAADGRFKSSAELRAEFAPLLGASPASALVHQCGSGVTACHNLLAMEHAGLTGSLLYPGSWSEWSADPARPVAVG